MCWCSNMHQRGHITYQVVIKTNQAQKKMSCGHAWKILNVFFSSRGFMRLIPGSIFFQRYVRCFDLILVAVV